MLDPEDKYNPADVPLDLEEEIDSSLTVAGAVLDEARRACAHDRDVYSPDEKIRVAIAYSLLGSIRATARETGVDEYRITVWMKRPWWPQVLASAKSFQDQKLHAKLTTLQHTIVDKLLAAIEKDPVFIDKAGTIQVGQHSLKDLSYALSVMGGQKGLIEQKTKPVETKDSTTNALARIAKALEDLGVAQEKKIVYDQPVERVEE